MVAQYVRVALAGIVEGNVELVIILGYLEPFGEGEVHLECRECGGILQVDSHHGRLAFHEVYIVYGDAVLGL